MWPTTMNIGDLSSGPPPPIRLSPKSNVSVNLLMGHETREALHRLIGSDIKEALDRSVRRGGDGCAADVRFDGLDSKGESNSAGAVFGRDGRGDSMDPPTRTD